MQIETLSALRRLLRAAGPLALLVLGLSGCAEKTGDAPPADAPPSAAPAASESSTPDATSTPGPRSARAVVSDSLPYGEVGAGLQMSPNAMKVLRALGVEDAVLADSLEHQRRTTSTESLTCRHYLGKRQPSLRTNISTGSSRPEVASRPSAWASGKGFEKTSS